MSHTTGSNPTKGEKYVVSGEPSTEAGRDLLQRCESGWKTWMDEPIRVNGMRRMILAIEAEASTGAAQAVERLAEVEHEQWIAWASSIIDTEPGLSPERVARWRSLFVPYSELSEEMKEHDRKWARIAAARLAEQEGEGE